MKPFLLHATANADERALVEKLGLMVGAGHTDEAADTLASHLQLRYATGFYEGRAEALMTWRDDS